MADGMPIGTGAAMAAQQQQIAAQRTMGAMVFVRPVEFASLLRRAESPVLVAAQGKVFFSISYTYLLPYKGLVFRTKTKTPLNVDDDVEVIVAKQIM